MIDSVITKIKEAGLVGRSGSGFPVWLKWEAVKNATANKKYVICNASEGEPGVFKDHYILEKYPEEVINGIKIALKTVGAATAYIYINKVYYREFKNSLTKLIQTLPIKLFQKPAGYLKGEETVLLNAIEGKLAEPRQKPPYPTEVGLWEKPTLINNVETFYWVSKIAKGEYKNNRFYSVTGDVKNKGVFELSETININEVLEKTNNIPSFPYFVQAGGGACGAILLPTELNQPINGIGSIIVFNKTKTNPLSLIRGWADFLLKENCDKCTPCREGIYRLAEIFKKSPQEIKNEENQKTINDIFFVLEKTSFCPFGRAIITPFKTAIAKLI